MGHLGSDTDNNRDEEIIYYNAVIDTTTGAISMSVATTSSKPIEYGQYGKMWNQTSVDGIGKTIMVKRNPVNNQ